MKSIPEPDEMPQSTNPKVRFLTPEQGKALFDRQARKHFGISGEEFIRAYEAGKLIDHPSQSDVEYVAFLIPFATF